jgi:hypothetical protein
LGIDFSLEEGAEHACEKEKISHCGIADEGENYSTLFGAEL